MKFVERTRVRKPVVVDVKDPDELRRPFRLKEPEPGQILFEVEEGEEPVFCEFCGMHFRNTVPWSIYHSSREILIKQAEREHMFYCSECPEDKRPYSPNF